MSPILTVFFVVLCVAVCTGHLCVLNPKQRGSLTGLDSPGSTDCFLTEGPCGSRNVEDPTTVFKSGGNYTIIFQKNLDHYTKATPGHFSVTLMNAGLSKEVARVPDGGEKSLNLYTVDINLAGIEKDTYILQVTYVTMNPQAPAVFYQCADVAIV